MRLKILIAMLILFANFPLILSQQKKKKNQEPCSNATTQGSLNACYCERAHKADVQLNDVYQQLLKTNARDTDFIEKLKISQRAWLAFREAQLEAIFSDDTNPRVTYGSVFTMCQCIAQEELTTDRVKQLRRMLHSSEGDVCAW